MDGRIPAALGADAIGRLPAVAGAGTPGQAGLGGAALVRWAGLGFVLLLVVGVLFVVVRYGDRDRGGDDGDTEIFSPGPAYGATGTLDVEEVLRIDEEGDGRGAEGGREPGSVDPDPVGGHSDGSGDRDRSGGGTRERSGTGGGDRAAPDDDAGGRQFTHDVRERRDGEWLVEVSDGDRSARFRVGKQGSITTIDPVASPGQRHGSNWVVAAERYLRDREFAIETERE